MSHDHFMVVCNGCGNVVSQCRCMGQKEIRHVDTCVKCASKIAESAPSASTNSAMDAIVALADRWCDSTNQPDNICVALYQFTSWVRQQHQ